MRGFRRHEARPDVLGTRSVIEWIRWIVVIGLIVGAYVEGKRQGAQDQVVQHQADAIEQRDAAIRQRDAEIAAGNERAGQQLVDLAALQTTIQSIERRTGSIGFQLKAALNESALATCVLPADVQRLRTDAHQQAADAVARANAARGGD